MHGPMTSYCHTVILNLEKGKNCCKNKKRVNILHNQFITFN